VEGEADGMSPSPARKEEESLISRFTGLLRRPGPEGEREPEVIFKDPVTEPPRGAPPLHGTGMIIPLRRGKGGAGAPETPPERKEEQPPPM